MNDPNMLHSFENPVLEFRGLFVGEAGWSRGGCGLNPHVMAGPTTRRGCRASAHHSQRLPSRAWQIPPSDTLTKRLETAMI